jgi:hypothetical protein
MLAWIATLVARSLRARPDRVLGRWGRCPDERSLDHRVYCANHDHCGACGTLSVAPPAPSARHESEQVVRRRSD